MGAVFRHAVYSCRQRKLKGLKHFWRAEPLRRRQKEWVLPSNEVCLLHAARLWTQYEHREPSTRRQNDDDHRPNQGRLHYNTTLCELLQAGQPSKYSFSSPKEPHWHIQPSGGGQVLSFANSGS